MCTRAAAQCRQKSEIDLSSLHEQFNAMGAFATHYQYQIKIPQLLCGRLITVFRAMVPSTRITNPTAEAV